MAFVNEIIMSRTGVWMDEELLQSYGKVPKA